MKAALLLVEARCQGSGIRGKLKTKNQKLKINFMEDMP